ncbi:hypothetical protein B0H14DRAFT_1595850 [Mycena olivaceomarginata]|nr:hypothetical protein B0H14DRAFT_1595850 [Mycena olivaceomarginata]
MRVTVVLSLSLFALAVSAALTNHTLDDQAPSGVSYYPVAANTNVSLWGFNTTRLFNGTVSYMMVASTPITVSVVFSGVSIYMFLALAPAPDGTTYSQKCQFLMDGITVGDYIDSGTIYGDGVYNMPAYANTSLVAGSHNLTMVAETTVIWFDYAVYTTDDVIPGATSPRPAHRKIPVAKIAGGAIGGVMGLLAFTVGLIFCLRARKTKTSPDPAKSRIALLSTVVLPGPSLLPGNDSPPAAQRDSAVLAEQVRLLREEVQQLKQHAEGNSNARSVSTMKREQMQAVRDHQDGYGVTDALEHTDTGLRLTFARVVDEMPPTYED